MNYFEESVFECLFISFTSWLVQIKALSVMLNLNKLDGLVWEYVYFCVLKSFKAYIILIYILEKNRAF